MTTDQIIAGVSAIATAVGAWVAVQQARKSAGSAEAARNAVKEIRRELGALRKTSDLTELQTISRQLLSAMGKYGPSSTATSLAGVSVLGDAKIVQEYLALIKEYRIHFGAEKDNVADQHCIAMHKSLEKFAAAHITDLMRKHGKSLYLEISEFSSLIKQSIESFVE